MAAAAVDAVAVDAVDPAAVVTFVAMGNHFHARKEAVAVKGVVAAAAADFAAAGFQTLCLLVPVTNRAA